MKKKFTMRHADEKDNKCILFLEFCILRVNWMSETGVYETNERTEEQQTNNVK